MHLFGPLLEQKKAPYAKKADGSLIPLGPFHHAYHFDQALVGRFFASKSQGRRDRRCAWWPAFSATRETGDVTALELDNGQRLDADFFIDATGFRKRLIVKEMQAPWISYAHELPVNRALPFWLDIKPGEEIANYTRAWAQEAAGCGRSRRRRAMAAAMSIRTSSRRPTQAKAEVERVLGREIEVRSDIRFQIGRLENAWIGNVLAVGLSSSFLEPLESTSIHGTIVQMMLFADRYLKHPAEMTPVTRTDYNERVGRQVDDFRTFVNTHYMTERDDTPVLARGAGQPHPSRDEGSGWTAGRSEMPRHEHFPEYLFGLPHIETQLHYPVLEGLGLLEPGLARQEMDGGPQAAAVRAGGL